MFKRFLLKYWIRLLDFFALYHSDTYCLRIADFIEDEIEGIVDEIFSLLILFLILLLVILVKFFFSVAFLFQ